MFLKIVEPESVTIYELDTSEFHYGHASIGSLEQIDEFAAGQIDSYRRHGKPFTEAHGLPVMWARFLCDGSWVCVVVTAIPEAHMGAYLMSDSGETIERIV